MDLLILIFLRRKTTIRLTLFQPFSEPCAIETRSIRSTLLILSSGSTMAFITPSGPAQWKRTVMSGMASRINGRWRSPASFSSCARTTLRHGRRVGSALRYFIRTMAMRIGRRKSRLRTAVLSVLFGRPRG